MQLSYSGGFKEAADTVAELESAGLDLVWGGRGLRLQRLQPHGLPGGQDLDGADRVGHPGLS
jgi:hypothetical protein